MQGVPVMPLGIGQYPAHVVHEYAESYLRRVRHFAQQYKAAIHECFAKQQHGHSKYALPTHDGAIIDGQFRELPDEETQPALTGGDATPITDETFTKRRSQTERSDTSP
jgi:hypothetical protein